MRELNKIHLFLLFIPFVWTGSDHVQSLELRKPSADESTSRHAVKILQEVGIGLVRSTNAENVVVQNEQWFPITIDFKLPSLKDEPKVCF